MQKEGRENERRNKKEGCKNLEGEKGREGEMRKEDRKQRDEPERREKRHIEKRNKRWDAETWTDGKCHRWRRDRQR